MLTATEKTSQSPPNPASASLCALPQSLGPHVQARSCIRVHGGGGAPTAYRGRQGLFSPVDCISSVLVPRWAPYSATPAATTPWRAGEHPLSMEDKAETEREQSTCGSRLVKGGLYLGTQRQKPCRAAQHCRSLPGGRRQGLLGQKALEHSSTDSRGASFLPGITLPAPAPVDFLWVAHSLRLHDFPHWRWEYGRPSP